MSEPNDAEVEKVARAICQSRSGPFSRWEGREDEYRAMARAAIDALRPQAPAEVAAWADSAGCERPIDAKAMEHLRQNPTIKVYLDRFSIPLYASTPSSEGKLREALAGRLYTMSEPHLSGARLVIGFNTIQDASAVQIALAALSPNKPSPDDGREGR